MNHQQSNVPAQPDPVSVAVPWLLFAVALVPYVGSLLIAIGELGDPPIRSNDWIQHLLLAGWLLLFTTAIFTAWGTRDRPTFAGVIVFCAIFTLFGLFFVL